MKKSKNKIKIKKDSKIEIIFVEKKKKRIPVAKKPPKIEPKRNAYKRNIEKKKLTKQEEDDN